MSKLKVPEGTSATLDDKTYTADEHGIMEVEHAGHAAILQGHPYNFEAEPEDPATMIASTERGEDPKGLELIKDEIEVADEVTVPALNVVVKALALSNLSVHDWNRLTDAERMAFIDQSIAVYVKDNADEDQAAADAAEAATASGGEKPDFSAMTRGTMIDWLRERGVEEGDVKDRKPVLIELCDKAWEDRDKATAEEVVEPTDEELQQEFDALSDEDKAQGFDAWKAAREDHEDES